MSLKIIVDSDSHSINSSFYPLYVLEVYNQAPIIEAVTPLLLSSSLPQEVKISKKQRISAEGNLM